MSDFDDLDLGAESNSAVFRVLQEALTNVARHARASRVAVELRRGIDALVVRVADDGAGIVLSDEDARRPRTLGILGMRERSRLVGGELAIASPESGGTVVELRVPLDPETAVTVS
jgi:two-component system sensor histidine kinase UhpB